MKANALKILILSVKTSKLSSLLKQQFNFHKSRIECLSAFIFGLIQARSINLSLIAQMMGYCISDSAYKRLQRFIQKITMAPDKLAYLIASIIALDKRSSWKLVFDRTNWKFGKKHINILFLAVCREHLSIPLFFTFLKDKKSGNSNQQDRILLIEKFIKTFGKKCIGLILGDREFIGGVWLNFLIKQELPFCVRLKEGWQKVSLPDGRMVEVKKCFPGLKKGEIRSLGIRQLGEGNHAVMCCITGLRNQKGEWVIVAHSEGLENPCEIYRQRWQIECMFRAMKTGGYNLEDTHVTEPDRLECLIGVVSIAYAICYKAGEFIVSKIPPKPKKHGYWPKSIVRYGIDAIVQAMVQFYYKPHHFKQLMRQILSPIRLTKHFFVL